MRDPARHIKGVRAILRFADLRQRGLPRAEALKMVAHAEAAANSLASRISKRQRDRLAELVGLLCHAKDAPPSNRRNQTMWRWIRAAERPPKRTGVWLREHDQPTEVVVRLIPAIAEAVDAARRGRVQRRRSRRRRRRPARGVRLRRP